MLKKLLLFIVIELVVFPTYAADEYYSGNVYHIIVKDKNLAEEIYNKLLKVKPEEKLINFMSLANKYSFDSGSASKGGYLGDFNQGTFPSEFENAAFSLNINEISKPVKTVFGWHLIYLVSKLKNKVVDLCNDQMKEELSSISDISEKNSLQILFEENTGYSNNLFSLMDKNEKWYLLKETHTEVYFLKYDGFSSPENSFNISLRKEMKIRGIDDYATDLVCYASEINIAKINCAKRSKYTASSNRYSLPLGKGKKTSSYTSKSVFYNEIRQDEAWPDVYYSLCQNK